MELAMVLAVLNSSHGRIQRSSRIMIVAEFTKCRDLAGEGKVFIKNKAKVASRVSCSKRRVVHFRKLMFKSDKKNSVLEELRVSRFAVIQEEICYRTFYK